LTSDGGPHRIHVAMPHTLFRTAFGVCGIAWDEAGLTAFQLPEETESLTEKHLADKGASAGVSDELPEWVRQIVARIQKHLEGELQHFSGDRIDWSRVSEFQRAVYRDTQAIKPGFKKSYGDISRALSLGPDGARAVGAALATNPWPLIVPCHRVVSATDRMTGFSAPGGVRTKTRLLVLEGAELLSE
jgi:methylated-DNA-[protein]-cysteine S-methyltransferase